MSILLNRVDPTQTQSRAQHTLTMYFSTFSTVYNKDTNHMSLRGKYVWHVEILRHSFLTKKRRKKDFYKGTKVQRYRYSMCDKNRPERGLFKIRSKTLTKQKNIYTYIFINIKYWFFFFCCSIKTSQNKIHCFCKQAFLLFYFYILLFCGPLSAALLSSKLARLKRSHGR